SPKLSARLTPPVTPNPPRTNPAPKAVHPHSVSRSAGTATDQPRTEPAEAHDARGRELNDEGAYREAIVEVNEAIRLKPDLARAYNARGYAYLRCRDYTRAIIDLNEAIWLNPRYGSAYRNRAAARRESGDVAGSEADMQKAREFGFR